MITCMSENEFMLFREEEEEEESLLFREEETEVKRWSRCLVLTVELV